MLEVHESDIDGAWQARVHVDENLTRRLRKAS